MRYRLAAVMLTMILTTPSMASELNNEIRVSQGLASTPYFGENYGLNSGIFDTPDEHRHHSGPYFLGYYRDIDKRLSIGVSLGQEYFRFKRAYLGNL